MDFKVFGSVLLIVGASIGAGMLALPIATAKIGFISAVILLFICWFVMTSGAMLLLEINLWLPSNSNLVSMAGATIGPIGQIISWITYLLLLYSLLCAYIAGGSDLFHTLLNETSGLKLPYWCSSIIFTFIFGSIIYMGIRTVDYANRGLMTLKFVAYLLLIIFLAPFISLDKLTAGQIIHINLSAVTITIVSFGYAAIVPSLRVYFAGDIKKLKKTIIIGGIIPLICYIAWDAVTMGVVPLQGPHGLVSIMKAENSTSALVQSLSMAALSETITFFVKLFTSVCVLTSFLSVGLCLTDFLADGFQVEKKGISNIFVHAATFLPPLLIVIFFPNAFIKALEYAGIYCIILLIFLPAWMAWRGRYKKHFVKDFRVPGGKPLLIFLMIFSVVVLMSGFVS